MSNWLKRITPWWNEKEVEKKEARLDVATAAAELELSRSRKVIESYRAASILIATTRK
jgi:hypothetical protein